LRAPQARTQALVRALGCGPSLRSIFKSLLVILVLLLLPRGCRQEASHSGGVVRLKYWPPPNRHDIKMTKPLVARWNREHPKIQIHMEPLPSGRSSEEVLLASIVGGTTPDICSNILTGTVERMVRARALFPLSTLPGFNEYVQQRSPDGTLDRFKSSDGKVYQLPWKANAQMLNYNVKLFKQFNITPPRTYSQFLAVAKKLTRDTDGDGRTDHWGVGMEMKNTWWKRFDDILPLYTAATSGKGLVEGDKVIFNSPAMVGAFKFVRTLFAENYVPRTFFAGDMFLRGKVAIFRGSGPAVKDLDTKIAINPKLKGFTYDFMPWPVPDGHKGPVYAFGDIKSMVVFSSCKHPAAAFEFLKYLTSEQADDTLMREVSQVPMRRKLFETEPFATTLKTRPKMATLARAVSHIKGTDDTIHLVEIYDILSQAFEAGAVLGLKPPEQAVAAAAKRAQRILTLWE